MGPRGSISICLFNITFLAKLAAARSDRMKELVLAADVNGTCYVALTSEVEKKSFGWYNCSAKFSNLILIHIL